MKINALITSVNYAEFLAHSIDRWIDGVYSLTVVTSPTDTETQNLVQSRHSAGKNVLLAITDLFYRDGATFNKGRSIEFARRFVMPFEDWILFADADVVPPKDWFARVTRQAPKPGLLYGCTRVEAKAVEDLARPVEQLPVMPHDVPGVGFFQLFHSQDPIVTNAKLPLLDTNWTHAGNYDNRFMDRWRKQGYHVQSIGMKLYHIGERDNWHGRGNKAAFAAMQAERVRRGGRWDHEVIPGPMPIDTADGVRA